MSVTVIIVNWNSGLLLQQCLSRLSQQSFPPQCVLVVDNASTDQSAACVARFPWVTLLPMTTNLGFAAGNNRALAGCDTEFVALLNPDAFPEPYWLERLLSAARARPDFAAFGSRQLCHDQPEVLDGAGDVYHVSGAHWRYGHGRAAAGTAEVDREIFGPCAAAALYRTDALREIGGFDESFFCYAEDIDIAFRLRLRGYRCFYVCSAVVRHVGSAVTGRRSDFAVYHGHRNLVWVYVKNMPGLLFWLYLPQHLFINFISIVRIAFRRQGRVVLRAKWDAVKWLPEVWRQRKELQANRKVGIWELQRVMARGLLTPYFGRGRE